MFGLGVETIVAWLQHNNTINFTQQNETIGHILTSWYIEYHQFSSWVDVAQMATLIDMISKGDVTRNDSQRRFLAQNSVAILEQCS